MGLFNPENRFNLANSITFANVACGVTALYFVTQKEFLIAIILAWIAGALDIADGKLL
jgi:CDP-diacylglycerol--serine O-phosphatidyltransferase